MKRILYFLFFLGFSIFFAVHQSFAENLYDMADASDFDGYSTDLVYVYHGFYSSSTEAQNAIIDATGTTGSQFNFSIDGDTAVYGIGKVTISYGVIKQHYAVYSISANYVDVVYDSTTLPPDADGDEIPDNVDLKPNSTDTYKAAIVSVCYDENNKVIAGVIQDGEGNQYSFGTMPTDFEGYTIESVSGDLVTYQTQESLASTLENLDIDELNITQQSSAIEVQDDGTIIPGDSDPFGDYNDAEENQTESETPTIQDAPSQESDTSDTDSDSYSKIVDNTDSTNKNLENIQGYLGISNDTLAKINENIKDIDSGSSVSDTGTTPTADEIGQAVEDNLIDSSQTIDTTTTDNISALDETDTLTAIQTKYSDRYDLFITTLKGSDLFSLPFGIFTGPSGSGSSIQTINIGQWGSTTDQTATVDYSDYDSIWDILRSILLLLTSFTCFKILVLKKA